MITIHLILFRKKRGIMIFLDRKENVILAHNVHFMNNQPVLEFR